MVSTSSLSGTTYVLGWFNFFFAPAKKAVLRDRTQYWILIQWYTNNQQSRKQNTTIDGWYNMILFKIRKKRW